MQNSTVLFWNVDTQNDFIEPSGKLYVRGAEELRPIWAEITKLAKRHKIKVINSADSHDIHSPELDQHPDLVTTFPPHCLAGSFGAEFIRETTPENPLIFKWDTKYDTAPLKIDVPVYRNFVILKNEFDMFAGNSVTEQLIREVNPAKVFVYGVTTNICVNYSVKGLVRLVKKVFVIRDAIKELPGLPLPFAEWEKLGVKMITFEELVGMIENK
jgi:nicotinamidase/pyrazinamidase